MAQGTKLTCPHCILQVYSLLPIARSFCVIAFGSNLKLRSLSTIKLQGCICRSQGVWPSAWNGSPMKYITFCACIIAHFFARELRTFWPLTLIRNMTDTARITPGEKGSRCILFIFNFIRQNDMTAYTKKKKNKKKQKQKSSNQQQPRQLNCRLTNHAFVHAYPINQHHTFYSAICVT